MSERIGSVAGRFLRTMLWRALWDSVREAEMPPLDFIRLALKSLPNETDEDLTRNQFERATRAYQRYLTPAQQNAGHSFTKIANLLFDLRASDATEVDFSAIALEALRVPLNHSLVRRSPRWGLQFCHSCERATPNKLSR